MCLFFQSRSSFNKLGLCNLIFLCLLTINAQAKNNGVADYKKGMKIFHQDRNEHCHGFKSQQMQEMPKR